MTEQDELSRLARAITNAEDNLNESNHRDDCETLAQMDETRSHLVERIDAREKALNDARDAFLALARRGESAVKVWEIETSEPADWEVATSALIETFKDPTPENGQAMREAFSWFQTAEPQPYSNGLDGHKED
jgi:hypothetical protein